MSKIITLRKGLDINLAGKPRESLSDAPQASEYALSPLDFEGVTPKLLVKVGDKVKAGTPLFFNKYNERVLFTSPVSGTVAAVNRGEKRKVLSVTVTPDGGQSYEEFGKIDLRTASREQIVELLLRSGLWPMIVQRPYGVMADPNDKSQAGASIPGMVSKVNVKPGDQVKVNDVLAVIEAMKMETSVVARMDGTIDEVFVKGGQTVKAGELLLTIK